MDDYMREMVDLKTLVTKTLEKKGVLARIRAELRANVFQAMEEQDHEAESNGASTFSLLGTCNERAKKLHSSPSGKLLMALVCEYMEWCELEHTLKVYLPELNQPRGYSRTELEDLLGMDGEPKLDDPDSRPLLLSLVGSYLKKKPSSSAEPPMPTKSTRPGTTGGMRQMDTSPAMANTIDHSEALESRVSLAKLSKRLDMPIFASAQEIEQGIYRFSSDSYSHSLSTITKKLSEKPIGGPHDMPFQSRSEADILDEQADYTTAGSNIRQKSYAMQGGANDGTGSPRITDEANKVYEKSSGRAQALLADLPQHRRSGLPAFSGLSRPTPNARGSNNGSANDLQSDTGGPYSRGSRDGNNDSMQKRREYTWREEDELRGGSFLNKKKESAWRDQDYDNLYSTPGGRAPTEKGDGKVNQPGENPTSQSRRGSSMDNTGKALGNLHLEDDSASDPGSRQSSGSRGTTASQFWQPAPRETSSANAPSIHGAGSKKQASAYFYSDSEDENAAE